MAAGATTVAGPLRRAVGAAVVAATLLIASAVFVVWWVATPGDCTALPPDSRAWTEEGVRPALRGTCTSLRPGDVVTAARELEGATAYAVRRGGASVAVVEPHGPVRLGAALAGGWSVVLFTAALALVAAYAFLRRPREPAVPPFLVLAAGLLGSSAVTLLGLPARAVASGWRWLFLFNVQVAYTLAWCGLVAFTLRFPPPLSWSQRPGRVAAVYAAPLAALAAAALLVPGAPGSSRWVNGLIRVQSMLTIALMLCSLAVIVHRFRHRTGGAVARQQLRLLAAGAWTSSTLVLAGWFMPQLLLGEPLLPFAWLGLPGLASVAALAVALTRFRLFDLDVLVNRTIVYAGLTSGVVIVYVFVVAGLAALLQTTVTPRLAVAGAAAVAVVVNPMRVRLQRAVNRLLYGDREDPYAALRRLGRRLAATSSTTGVLPAAAADVQRALRVPFVAIDLAVDGATVRAATAGAAAPDGEAVEEPLVHRGETLGRLVVAHRAPGETPGPGDRRLIADLAHQIATAAEVARLHLDLQRSRERLVLAREEERRVLRRRLHDEVGPAVAALALQAETARRMLAAPGQPAEAAAVEVLGALRRDAVSTARVLRGLAYDLRPPALDDLGLVGALREHGARLEPLAVTVEAPPDLGGLPAAVEVAAYRIAVEAMANAARHASAGACTVRLARGDGALLLDIADDGRGLPPGFRAGVGVTAMRERAAELGGTCEIGPGPSGGTRVTATLPFEAGP